MIALFHQLKGCSLVLSVLFTAVRQLMQVFYQPKVSEVYSPIIMIPFTDRRYGMDIVVDGIYYI